MIAKHNNDISIKSSAMLTEDLEIVADILFEEGQVIVDGEWVEFCVEALLKKQKRLQSEREKIIKKIVDVEYVINCYREELLTHREKKVILAHAKGATPVEAFEGLDLRYAVPLAERLKRQYSHLFKQ